MHKKHIAYKVEENNLCTHGPDTVSGINSMSGCMEGVDTSMLQGYDSLTDMRINALSEVEQMPSATLADS